MKKLSLAIECECPFCYLYFRLQTPNYMDIPFLNLAVGHGGNKIMANTVAIGAVLGMLGMDLNILAGIIKDAFKKKGDEIIQGNVKTAVAGHDFAVKNCQKCSFSAAPLSESKMLIAGN